MRGRRQHTTERDRDCDAFAGVDCDLHTSRVSDCYAGPPVQGHRFAHGDVVGDVNRDRKADRNRHRDRDAAASGDPHGNPNRDCHRDRHGGGSG